MSPHLKLNDLEEYGEMRIGVIQERKGKEYTKRSLATQS